nr:protein-export chaperone SecB [uncultured Pedobacter sp.]
MDQIKNSPFRLESFTVIESHIVREPDGMGEVDIDIIPKGILNRPKKNFSLFLDVIVKDNSSFTININCVGVFRFKSDISEQEMSNYFLVNAPAIIFPYVRSYISAMTALSGLKAINLPVMNLSSLKEELKKSISDISEKKQPSLKEIKKVNKKLLN